MLITRYIYIFSVFFRRSLFHLRASRSRLHFMCIFNSNWDFCCCFAAFHFNAASTSTSFYSFLSVFLLLRTVRVQTLLFMHPLFVLHFFFIFYFPHLDFFCIRLFSGQNKKCILLYNNIRDCCDFAFLLSCSMSLCWWLSSQQKKQTKYKWIRTTKKINSFSFHC